MRIGHGYDIHRLVDDRDLVLGGIKIPNKRGLLGHSDADALIHAIIDSLFGAMALGDIGDFFPDNKAEFKDIKSVLLLEKTVQLLKAKGYKIINTDSTIICQNPKLAPFKTQIKENIASLLQISPDDVSIKAKTKEGLDAVGKNEAIEVYSCALIDLI